METKNYIYYCGISAVAIGGIAYYLLNKNKKKRYLSDNHLADNIPSCVLNSANNQEKWDDILKKYTKGKYFAFCDKDGKTLKFMKYRKDDYGNNIAFPASASEVKRVIEEQSGRQIKDLAKCSIPKPKKTNKKTVDTFKKEYAKKQKELKRVKEKESKLIRPYLPVKKGA